MSTGTSLRELRQWVCWRAEERGGKLTKVPYSPASGLRARCDDPTSWGAFAEARETARERGYEGIGFVFTAADPFCGVDLDGCVDPETGEVEPWAMEIVRKLDSYTELSPSGTGLHIIVKAKLPEGGNRRGRFEMYDRGRFFTVTGRRLPGASHRIEDRQERIAALHACLFSRHEGAFPSANGAAAPDNNLDDAEVLHRAISAANGERFSRLWVGDSSGYPSDSEADLALCSMLAFWVGPDEDRIASLFSRSGLAREKWDRKDYRRRTISRALDGMTDFYTPGQNGAGPSRNGHHRSSGISIPNGPSPLPSLPEAPAFPVEAMPSSCRPLIEEATDALGCAPELVALPMLAVLSSAVGTSCVVEIKGGWREWASLFVAVVASPGAMKTPAAKVAKKPAFERQRALSRAYAEEKEDWSRELREWEVEKRDAAKSGEPAPEMPEAPSMGRCVASDTTVEALVGILEDNPRGLLVHRDELAGWVRSMDQYKGGKGSDRQHWLSFWSGDEVVVDRKSRMGEPIIVARPFVSLFGGIQPAMLGELGGGAEDGLMDRFLFAYPAPRRIRFTEEEVSAEAEERYAALYDNLANLKLATDEHGDPNPKPLKLTPEARRLFAQAVDALGAEVLDPGFPRRLEGVWAKLRGYLARLSLVLAVCRCAETGVREERVEAEDVEAAVRLLGYFKAHARRVYAELSAPDSLDLLAGGLRDLLEESGGKWEGSATDLHRALDEREAASLPGRPEELSKLVLRIGERSPVLEAVQGWRKTGGREGKSRRVLKLALVEPAQEPAKNAVDPVVAVDPVSEGDNGTNGNNGKNNTVDPREPEGDNSDNGNNGANARAEGSPASAPADATDARSADGDHHDDGRERFTL
ncbi:hypothetical protein RxyAA322_13160 [Rubrobacter xylanophilus]|uniref:NrS-1 polymerase-like HBD domain-containing protein n=1 Tax=Rubrobacter xylanophilus TaxID=49319 RepID=A0A510HHI9_9ACTN|nr:hypothetical protein RxyAA322_13160 [Rubrobacter xylanophilus]